MSLGPYMEYDGVDYECTICERLFDSSHALHAHCRDTSRHSWCEKCHRVFISESAKTTHLKNSQRHNICWLCPQRRDFATHQELKDHLSECHYYCDVCELSYRSAQGLQQHDITEHYLCVECGHFFANENNLRMHQQAHQPRSMECYGCYQTFKSFSGMLIHLESGACQSDTDEDVIDNIAHDYYESSEYIVDPSDGGRWLYSCPECEKEFRKLSALYQHVEDVLDCSCHTEGGGCLAGLRRFIKSRI